MSRVLPILFNTEMVRAILAGKKTETRRVMKPANPFRNREGYFQGSGLWIDGYNKEDTPNGHVKDYSISSCWMPKKHYIDTYAPYKPEDILYVRETWQYLYELDGNEEIIKGTGKYYYAATDSLPSGEYVDSRGSTYETVPWKPSIHMPKAAARIWLKVTEVRVERLQDIDDDGVVTEGLQIGDPYDELWNSTIKKKDLPLYGWDANPWVWVIEFERCEKPESEVSE